MDYTDMTTAEIEAAITDAQAEIDRREREKDALTRVEHITTQLLEEAGGSDGGPWVETALGYPKGYRVTYPLPDSEQVGTWVNRRRGNVYAPGSEGGGWQLQGPDENTPPLWIKPAWAEVGYDKGDLVTFPTYEDGRVYRSLLDRNTWSPTDYPDAWELVTEDTEPDPGGGDGYPVWVKPVYAGEDGGAYALGDRVHYPDADGPVYESTHDGWNTWSPEEYPDAWAVVEAP